MIIYDPKDKNSFFDYGIQIPVYDETTAKTIDFLENHPVLGSYSLRWYTKPDYNLINIKDLQLVHDPEYIERLFSDGLEKEIIRTYELITDNGEYHRYAPETAIKPLEDLFKTVMHKVNTTYQCGLYTLDHGFCFSLSGGMHHAHYSYGSGFCMLNDVVIAARKLLNNNLCKKIWIIDVDAHKGDGTAALTYNDPDIITLSIHMGDGWPLHIPYNPSNPVFIPSNVEIPVYNCDGWQYNLKLYEGLNTLLSQYPKPELAFVLSGVDPFEKDELISTSTLNLTKQELFIRDTMIYNFLKENSIPSAYLMAGGYGEFSWEIYAQFLEYALTDRLGLEGEQPVGI